jgi:hypothetical protein
VYVDTPSGDKANGVLKLTSYFHLVPTVWTGKHLHFIFTLNTNKAHRVFWRGHVREERGKLGKKTEMFFP